MRILGMHPDSTGTFPVKKQWVRHGAFSLHLCKIKSWDLSVFYLIFKGKHHILSQGATLYPYLHPCLFGTQKSNCCSANWTGPRPNGAPKQQDHNSAWGLNPQINLDTGFEWFISRLFVSAVNESILHGMLYKLTLRLLFVHSHIPPLPALPAQLTHVDYLWPGT